MPMTINGTTYSDEQIKQLFANSSNGDIANLAAKMGVNADQVAQAAQIAGKGWTTNDVTGWAGANGFNFNGANGSAQAAPRVNGQGGMYAPNGQWLSKQQITDFYANGGDDNKFAQDAGATDPWLRRELILQARQLAGPGTMGGDGALQTYFKRYQQYNPNGTYANDFNGWMNDQGTHTLDAMRSGTFTGAPSSPSDWAPGGIYNTGHDFSFDQGRNGTGAHGTGDGWTPWSGAGGENARVGSTNSAQPGTGYVNRSQPGTSNGGGYMSGGFTPYWGGSPWWETWGGGNTNGMNQGGGYPVGQYAWGQQRNRQSTGYGSWPVYPGSSGGGYVPASSGNGSNVNSGDRMYGDYTNGW